MTAKRTDMFFITEVVIFVFACFLISKPCLCNENGIKISLVLTGVNFEENHFYTLLLNGKRVKPVLNTTKIHDIYVTTNMQRYLELPWAALFGNVSDFTILH